MVSDGKKGPVAVRGISVADPSKSPPRLELRDMRKFHPDQWNLLLLGMERFKIVKETEPMSFYQIAGIHGLPFETPWPNQTWNHEKLVQTRGYCTHSSILFLPWHRPYLSLFEMALHKHVTDVAGEFKESENRSGYLKAAQEFRLPYWDWARPTNKEVTLFPMEVATSTKFTVIRPGMGGQPKPMDYNPLSTYVFQDNGEGQNDSRIDRFKSHRTLRYPSLDGKAADEKVVRELQGLFDGTSNDFEKPAKGLNLTERTYFILKAYEEFSPMSSNQIPGGGGKNGQWFGWGSLEDIHNSVHGYVGGGGHMGSPPTAAFDPVFWFHHCNIDRLFAIWSALHDDGEEQDYVVPTTTKNGTKTTPRGTEENLDTKLAPFTQSETAGDYWTARDVKDTTTFGYTYPEIVSKRKEDIFKKLDAIYPGASLAASALMPAPVQKQTALEFQARAQTHQIVAQALDLGVPLTVPNVQQEQAPLPAPQLEKLQSIKVELPKDRDFNDLIVDNKYLEWLVDVRAFKYANNGDFLVHFFLGPPEDEYPRLYIFNPNHVATFSTFGQGAQSGCVKCQDDRDQGLIVAGQIPLTLGLVERYIAGPTPNNLGVDEIEDYLARNLHWRVTTNAGELLPRDSIRDLLVGVVTNEVTLPADGSGRQVYAPDVVPRPRATTREDGNAGRGDGTGYVGGSLEL